MSLVRALLRPSGQADDPQDADAAQLHEARVEAARRNSAWTEIDSTDLVPRGYRGSLLVSAETDAVNKVVRGAIYAPGEAHSSFAAMTPLYVAVTDGLTFYKREPYTWTERVGMQTKRRTRS